MYRPILLNFNQAIREANNLAAQVAKKSLVRDCEIAALTVHIMQDNREIQRMNWEARQACCASCQFGHEYTATIERKLRRCERIVWLLLQKPHDDRSWTLARPYVQELEDNGQF
jgi:hypothetical protein